MPEPLYLAAPEFGSKAANSGPPRPSLFILSLPRSLSSLVHEACCRALDLRGPAWTSDGEVMNVERSIFLSDRALCAKYTLPRLPHLFGPATDFLAEVTQPHGFCYKDVTQPFVTSAWLRTQPHLRVLKIVPNIAHTALAMLRRNWLYPTIAAPPGQGDIPARLIVGLTRAADAMATVSGESVAFDDLLAGPDALNEALARLYPEFDLPHCDFGVGFGDGRAEVLARRELPIWPVLEAHVRSAAAPERLPTV